MTAVETFLKMLIFFLIFAYAAYVFGLRLSYKKWFFRIATPKRGVLPLLVAVARSRLRKRESIKDLFVFQIGREPNAHDIQKIQRLLILGFAYVFAVLIYLIFKQQF